MRDDEVGTTVALRELEGAERYAEASLSALK